MFQAGRYVSADLLGTIDDCGFSPFNNDIATTCEATFAEIRARIEGTGGAFLVIGDS